MLQTGAGPGDLERDPVFGFSILATVELADFELLDLTSDTARSYAVLRVALKKAGRPIPANDAWIAALALQHKRPLLSRDGHFDAGEGLERRTW